MDIPHDRGPRDRGPRDRNASGTGEPSAVGGRRGRGRVIREDTIALLHRGNRVIATTPADAADELDAGDPAGEVHYHFPVEIEVRSIPRAMEPDEIVERALERLARALEGD